MISTADRLADRYVLGDLLGQGGMGSVHRAHDERLDREVAVKVLPVPDGGLDDRLRNEARVLAKLDHPTLVRILDADEVDGQPFIVMDLVEGDTLAIRLRQGALPEPEVRSLTRQVAEGLVHAHAQGIIHRDLKPSNLVVEPDGRVRVVDFGIARLTDATGLTQPGTAVGTAAYLAPEQLQGDGDVGPPADVYTLGLVALECLRGRRPFEGDAVETALARLREAPPIGDDLPEPWPSLLRRMTAIDPGARPTAAEVVDLLDQPAAAATPLPPADEATGVLTGVVDLDGTTGRLHAAEVPAPAAPVLQASAPPEEPGPPPAPPDRLPRQLTPLAKRRLALAALAVVAVVLAIVLATTLTTGDDGRADRPARSGNDVPADVADALEDLREAIRP